MPKTIHIDGVIGRGTDDTGRPMIDAAMIRSQLPENGTDPIHVTIHSEGGEVYEGFAIHDLFAAYRGPKTLSIESTAFSIASFVAMAFDQIEMAPNAYYMIHHPRVGGSNQTSAEKARDAEELAKLEGKLIAAYAKRTGRSDDEIRELMQRETYFDAEESVAIGLADRIAGQPIACRRIGGLSHMPHRVVTALFGAGLSGEKMKGIDMSDKPRAATVREIKARFPKMSDKFMVSCLEKELPLDSVATAAAEELMNELEEAKSRIAQLEEELEEAKAEQEEEAKAKAEQEEEMARAEQEEEETRAEEEEAKAKARRAGVKPVAKGTKGGTDAVAEWNKALAICTERCRGDRAKAAIMANRENPGLRQRMLAQAGRR